MNVTPTPAQEQAALAWLSLLHDQPSSGDQATFSQWLRADPAHVEAYSQAQVLWELSEVPARKLADEEALALQGYLNAMHTSKRSRRVRWSGALAMAACSGFTVPVLAGCAVRFSSGLRSGCSDRPHALRGPAESRKAHKTPTSCSA